jgi:hypothetical protein
MNTICYPENNNSFTVEDWSTVGVSCHGLFTSTVPIQRAPKKLISFAWSRMPSIGKQEATPDQEFRAAVDSLYQHSMTKKEAAYFRREKASKFVPLKPEQSRLLPSREK